MTNVLDPSDGVHLDSRAERGAPRGSLRRLLPGLDDVEQRCWDQYVEASTRIWTLLQRTLQSEHGLGLSDVRLLAMLADAKDGSCRMGELAHELVERPSRVTEQTHRLETQGLLSRRPSERDHRGITATISRAGRDRLRAAMTTYAGIVRQYYLDPLTRGQMTATGDSSRRVSEELRRLR